MKDDDLKAARNLLLANGYQFYRNKIWKDDPQFMAIRARVKALGISGIPDDRAFFLMEAARKLSVTGSIVECGVRFGRSTYYIASAARDRHIEVFDSFEGLSIPSEQDGGHWKAGDCRAELDVFQRNLTEFATRLTIHKGWIPDTLERCETPLIALLHLDLDLYDPTKAALEFFWPRMAQGGLVVCDDYGSSLCPGAKLAFDEFFEGKTERPLGIPTGQCIVTKL